MHKTRAFLAAVVGVTLAATGALAASSVVSSTAKDHTVVGGPNENHGGAVSTLARDMNGAPDTTIEAPAADPADATDGAQGAHGAAVSAVAQDETAVGGPNANHGGAVSLVARGTHGPAATHGKSAGKSQAGAHKPSR